MAYDPLTDDDERPARRGSRAAQSRPAPTSAPTAPSYRFRQPQGPMFPSTDPPVPDRTFSGGPYTTPGTPGSNNDGINPQPSMPAGAVFNGNRFDDHYMRQQLQRFGTLPGVDPTVTTDPEYWLRRMRETGGLGPDNVGYWENKALTEYKKPMPGAGGSARAGGMGGGNNLGFLLQLLGSRLTQPQQPGMTSPAAPEMGTGTSAATVPLVDIEQIIRQALGRGF